MANSLSNLHRTAFHAFDERLRQGTSNFERFCAIYTTDESTLTFTQPLSAGGFTAYSAVGTAVTKDVLGGKMSFTTSPYAKIHKITWSDIRNNPELPGQIGTMLANQAMAAINELAMAGLESLFAADHPLAGTGAGQVGGSKKYLDTSLATVNGTTPTSTQSNLFTAPLSRAALVGACQTMRAWKAVGNDDNLLLGNDASSLHLVVGSTNMDLAHSLLGSSVQDANLQVNSLAGMIGGYTVHPFATDADDFFVIDRAAAPVGMWLRERPVLGFDVENGGLDLVFSCRYHADFVYDVEGAGIIGSNVA